VGLTGHKHKHMLVVWLRSRYDGMITMQQVQGGATLRAC
jgi:hypothetical protein